MAEPLFRQQVIDAHRDRLAGTVIAAVPPSARLYGWLIGVAVLVLFATLTFGSYARTAPVRGVLAYDMGLARVFAADRSEVRAVHVRTGQQVQAGDPLVTLSLTQGIGGASRQLAQLDSQDAELARQMALAASIGSAESSRYSQMRQSLSESIASLERQRALAAGQVSIAEAALRRATRLAADGAGTQRQVDDSRAALLARRADYESLNERLISQRENLTNAGREVGRQALDARNSISVLAGQRAALAAQREMLARSDVLTLTAPTAGTVGDVSIEVGQRADPDTSLVTVVPTGSRLEIWLYATSRAVGFSRPRQRVRLKFDAFPFQKYGMGEAVVTDVSRVPIEPRNIGLDLGSNEPVFRIRARVEHMPARTPVPADALRPGMTISASLVLEERNLWQVLFGPLVEAMNR